MSYRIDFREEAIEGLNRHKRSGNKGVLKKIELLLSELQQSPASGTGQPEQLKYGLSGYWSRRINKEHRLIYRVEEDVVIIISVFGHYE